MSALDERLAQTIRRIRCPVHGRKAVFSISIRVMRLDCCCNRFRIICLGALVKVMTEMKERLDRD